MGAVGAAIAIAVWVSGYHFDFVYDWLSARAFVSGVDPYQPLPQLAGALGLSAETGPIHPRIPAALLLLSPAGFVGFAESYYLGRLLTVGSAFFLAWVLARLARKPPFWFLTAVPVGLLVWPFSTVLKVSQPGFFIAGLIGATWLMGNRWIAGLPLAGAVSLKMWPWLLVPALWLAGRRKAAAGAAATFTVLNLIGLAWPNVTLEGTWRMLTQATEIPSDSLTYLLGVEPWISALIGLALIVVLRNQSIYMLAVPIALLVAPIFWVAYMPALLVPAVAIMASDRTADAASSDQTSSEQTTLAAWSRRVRHARVPLISLGIPSQRTWRSRSDSRTHLP